MGLYVRGFAELSFEVVDALKSPKRRQCAEAGNPVTQLALGQSCRPDNQENRYPSKRITASHQRDH